MSPSDKTTSRTYPTIYTPKDSNLQDGVRRKGNSREYNGSRHKQHYMMIISNLCPKECVLRTPIGGSYLKIDRASI